LGHKVCDGDQFKEAGVKIQTFIDAWTTLTSREGTIWWNQNGSRFRDGPAVAVSSGVSSPVHMNAFRTFLRAVDDGGRSNTL
jgi:hypothetical protein